MNIDEISKPKSNAKLKTLSPNLQAELFQRMNRPSSQGGGYRKALTWLGAQGLATSLRALSEFYRWYRLRERLESHAQTVETVLQKMKHDGVNLTEWEMKLAGQAFFSALTIESGNARLWAKVQNAKGK